MKAYSYVAYTAEGRRKTGTVIGETETHATHQLQEQGLFPSELTARARGRSSLAADFGRARLSAELQAVLTRQLAVLLAADLPAEAALKAVRAGGSPALEKVAANAQAALEQRDRGFVQPPHHLHCLIIQFVAVVLHPVVKVNTIVVVIHIPEGCLCGKPVLGGCLNCAGFFRRIIH